MDKLLNVVELEGLSGVSRHTWRSWFRQGRVPVIRLGRRVLVAAGDFEALVAAGRIPARTQGAGR